jgi:glutamate--cysteine ligase
MYDGSQGILAIFRELVTRYGWTAESEMPGGPTICLKRGQSVITLEPGGQVELSGAPLKNAHEVHNECQEHVAELVAVGKDLGLSWLGVGFHPTARQEDLGWVPKARYGIMRVYLQTKGSRGLDMMRRTATVQANFDFQNEEDAMRKLRVSLRVSPIVAAMFANSPFYKGKPFGGKSERLKVWLDVDPDRQGLVPCVWNEKSNFRDYIEWALDVPMFLVKHGALVIENTGQSFRSFMQDGFGGHHATLSDWATHINTLFPEVRLKRTLEVRGADSVPFDLIAALPALWTGLFYDEQALSELENLSADYTFDEMQALRLRTANEGLRAQFRGKPLAEAAQKVLEASLGGLRRRAILDESGRDEGRHLDTFVDLVAKGQTLADRVLERFNSSGGEMRDRIFEACKA